jgi:transposase InsO family protein
MKERVKFILAWEERWQESQGGRIDVAELCRVFGVSRDTGHRWIRRYREANHDLRALEERSRRPRSSPTATSQPIQDFIVGARKARPRWGPRKLRAWLVDRYPGRSFPSAATFASVLKRHGLTTPRRKGRRRVPGVVEPFAPATSPNAVWCIDFKGHFRTGDGDKCLPMTVVDAFSRYCLRCEVVQETTYEQAQWVLDSAFREFGLPAAIRSDNGPPFAARGPAGLSRLAVWLLRLAIRVERIQPGKPQQNGRLERFHRTLKAETASPAERKPARPAAHVRPVPRRLQPPATPRGAREQGAGIAVCPIHAPVPVRPDPAGHGLTRPDPHRRQARLHPLGPAPDLRLDRLGVRAGRGAPRR